MKKLTLDLYERIINTFHEQTRNNLKLLGHVTPDECAEYIGFYAFHGGLFWSESNGKITAVATSHPGKRQFDWQWGPDNGIWTTHCVWASSKHDLATIIHDFLSAYSVKQFYACRRESLTHLDAKKLERILSYGRIKTSTSSTGSASLQRVNEVDPEGSGRDGSGSLCERGGIPAEVSSASVPDPESGGGGSDGTLPEAPARLLQT